MNQKERNELRRRFSPERNTISKIYGAYVNTAKNVVARFEESLGLMEDSEREKYLGLLKGVLGGTIGRNLVSIPFSVAEAQKSESHQLLTDLRRASLADAELRDKLVQKIVDSFAIEDANLLILMADDVYDVPKRNRNDDADGSDTVYHYFLCAVCPVKDGRAALGYLPESGSFHSATPRQIVGAPVAGFVFPSFDGRAANVYAAAYFSKDAGDLHEGLIAALFGTEAPMSSKEQKDAFQEALAEGLAEDCRFDVVRDVHEQLRERIVVHKESRDPDPLELTPAEVGDILAESGVDEARVTEFRSRCTEKFGGEPLLPGNLITPNRFRLKTEDAAIAISPDAAAGIECRVIDGRKYILIPADHDVEINGLNVKVK